MSRVGKISVIFHKIAAAKRCAMLTRRPDHTHPGRRLRPTLPMRPKLLLRHVQFANHFFKSSHLIMASHNSNAVCRPPPDFGNWSSIAAERRRRLKHDIVAKRNLAQLQMTLPYQLLFSLVSSFGGGSCVVDERYQRRNDQQCSYPIAHTSIIGTFLRSLRYFAAKNFVSFVSIRVSVPSVASC